MHFILLMLGLGFILIDFSVQGIDILPDIIGYIMLLISCTAYIGVNDHFKRARNVSLIMIIVGVFTFLTPVKSFVTEMANIAILSILLSLTIYAIELILMYSILMGIAELSRSKQNQALSSRSMQLWKYYWILTVTSFVGTLIALFLGVLGLFLVIGFGIAHYVVAFMILKMVYDGKATISIT